MTGPPVAAAVDERPPGSLRHYVSMARPDHWIKHLFILPGIVLALILLPVGPAALLRRLLPGLASAAALASANYVLNEWLDARHDRYHPLKSARPAVARRLSPALVWGEYLVLAALGLALAWSLSGLFGVTGLAFLISGWVYNVPPLRSKDRPYLDVLTESINNPIRLILGWAMVDSLTLPPSSLLLAYWMGGAFLMTVKRLAELRWASSSEALEALASYRPPFRRYSDRTLLLASFLYGQLAAFFLAVFLIKYRIEYILSLPFFAALFGAYLWVGLKDGSAAQSPERLYREKTLLLFVFLLVAALAMLTWVELPILERLTAPHYIRL